MELMVICVLPLRFVAKWNRHSADNGVRWWLVVGGNQGTTVRISTLMDIPSHAPIAYLHLSLSRIQPLGEYSVLWVGKEMDICSRQLAIRRNWQSR